MSDLAEDVVSDRDRFAAVSQHVTDALQVAREMQRYGRTPLARDLAALLIGDLEQVVKHCTTDIFTIGRLDYTGPDCPAYELRLSDNGVSSRMPDQDESGHE